MALRGWLPLDHDRLIGAAARDDRLRGGAGRLLGESKSAAAREVKREREVKEETKSETMH